MKTLTTFFAVLLSFTASVSAIEINSRQFISLNTSSSRSKVPTTLSKVAGEFSVNVSAMSTVFKSTHSNIKLTEFPVSKNETVTLYLTPAHSVIDSRTEWFVGLKRKALPDVVAYRGVIEGEPNSKVLLNYANGDLIGTVVRGNGEQLTVSPFGLSKENERTHTIAPESAISKLNDRIPFNCGTDESQASLEIPKLPSGTSKSADRTLSTKLMEVEVIVETTTGFFTRVCSKNEDRAAAYIVSLYNMVSLINEDEMNVTFKIVKTQIWTEDEPDGYKNSGVSDGKNEELKIEFVNRWKGRSTPRDLVNLLSTPGSTKVLGIANGIGGICNNTDGSRSGYAVCGIQAFTTLPTFSYNEEVVTIAHENGHVFGAAHTHNCVWNPPLDSCLSKGIDANNPLFLEEACNSGTPIYNGGSIMSYCHLWNRGVAMTFLPRVYTFLRENLETKACLTEPSTSLIKVEYPRGNQIFKSGLDTVIRWTVSEHVQNVRIEFSSDDGATWATVPDGDNISAKFGGRNYGQGELRWKVPSVSTTKGLIRVSDAANSATFGTVLAPFTIQSTVLTLQYPLGGEKFGQKEKFNISWLASQVNNVKVEFSSDGGATWITITSTGTSGSLTYDVPDIETTQGIIRVSDASNNTLVSQSGQFSIGKEKIYLRTPNGGDTVCSTKDFTINWSTDFIGVSTTKVRIQYSVNNGASWLNITNTVGVDASSGIYVWSATKTASTSAILKIIYRNDTTITAISQKGFTIDAASNCVAVGVDEPLNEISLGALSVTPNPISTQGTATVEFPSACAQIEFALIDAKGSLVTIFGKYDNMAAGKHELQFDVSNITSGAYFITLSCGGQRVSAPLTILR